MAHTSFAQEIFIPVAPEVVRDFFSTLNNHPKIHPLIIAIHPTKTITALDGTTVQYYRIQDQIHQGPFTFRITYRVSMNVNTEGEIISDAYQFPGIVLHNTTQCLPEQQGTRVKEHIVITSPRLLINTVYTQAKSSHWTMLENLKKTLVEATEQIKP